MLKHLATLIAVLSIISLGCGPSADIAPLSGVVRYKGKPLEFGSVMLQPAEGGHTATAVIQSDGSFVMKIRDVGDGAAVGLNRIRVTCYPAQRPGKSASSNQELALGKSLIPSRYANFGSSDLSVEVLAGENEPLVIELDNK